MRRLLPLFALTSLLLAGCDQLGIESATVVAEHRAAEGKAIGAACRHAGRAIEDCYTLNKKAEKAAIYAGWREMDDYMRENKLEPVVPQIKPAEPKPKPAEGDEAADDHADEGPASKPAAGGKAGAKKASAH
ncbi:MAG TPA: hypothetical protein VLA16_25055 [Ideonella sp.]|nr:hypothetical protein [Ideonella sp.]